MIKETIPRFDEMARLGAVAATSGALALTLAPTAHAETVHGLDRYVQNELAHDIHGLRNTGGFSAAIHGRTETFKSVSGIKYGEIAIDFQTPTDRRSLDYKQVESLKVDEYIFPSSGHRILVNGLSAHKDKARHWELSVRDANPVTGEHAAKTDSTLPTNCRIGRLTLRGATNFNKQIETLFKASAYRDVTPIDMGIPKGF